MKVSSRKNKGRRLQNKIKELLLEKFYESLEDDDVRSTPMGVSGADLMLSPRAKTYIPFDIEAKNQESISIWKCIEQAEANTEDDRTPLLVFKRNKSKIYAVLEFEKLLEFLPSSIKEPVRDSDENIDMTHREKVELIWKWFRKGQNAAFRRNKSGCACIIDEIEDVAISVCGFHEAWFKNALSASEGKPEEW